MLNVATLGLSVLALTTSVVSVYILIRQVSLQDKANNSAAVVTLLSEFRDPRFHESFERLFDELPKCNPEQGLSGLPPHVRHHVYNVCYFLNQIGCMMVLGVIREDAFLALIRARTMSHSG